LIALFFFFVGLSIKDGISGVASIGKMWPLLILAGLQIIITYYKLSK
jgi:hypothetical protein